MRQFVLVIVAVQIAVCLSQQYNTRYDNLDINKILSNRRVLGNYVKCILDEGPCTAEGRELKTHIPDALATSCAKCTPAQRNFVKKGSLYLVKNEPGEWKKITKKYDPQGKQAAKFQEFLKA